MSLPYSWCTGKPTNSNLSGGQGWDILYLIFSLQRMPTEVIRGGHAFAAFGLEDTDLHSTI